MKIIYQKLTNYSVLFIASYMLFLTSGCTPNMLITDEQYTSDFSKFGDNSFHNNSAVNYDKIDVDLTQKGMNYSRLRSITIFNEDAENSEIIKAFYDNFKTIKKMNVLIRSLDGKILKFLTINDATDLKARSSSFDDEERVKFVNYKGISYPFIIETEIVIFNTNTINIPNWFYIDDERLTRRSTYTLTYNISNPVKYRKLNSDIEPEIVELDSKRRQLIWKAEYSEPYDISPFSEGYMNQIPHVRFIQSTFVYGNTTGSFNSWREFGDW